MALSQKKIGPFAMVFLTLLAVYLELQFYVMTIVGLVDVWRNFRHLPRGKKGHRPRRIESEVSNSRPRPTDRRSFP